MGLVELSRHARARLLDWTAPQRVVFHHVPKCGGTSVGRALRKRYILSQATVKPEESFRAFEAFTGREDREQMLVDVLDLREQMMLYLLFEDVHCISLHVRFSERAYDLFRDRYKFVTILREPVDRFMSHFFWSYGKHQAHGRIDEDFETFLGTERARRLGSTYSEFYCGLPSNADFSSDHAVERAIANLQRFDVLGSLDDLPKFERDIRSVLGVRVTVGHENRMKQSKTKARREIGEAWRDRVLELCQPDITIWQAASAGLQTSVGPTK